MLIAYSGVPVDNSFPLHPCVHTVLFNRGIFSIYLYSVPSLTHSAHFNREMLSVFVCVQVLSEYLIFSQEVTQLQLG